MAERRRYTKRDKTTAVIAAELSSVAAAAESTGIPATTIDYWFDKPEFVELRRKTREDVADESKALVHKVLSRINDRLPDFEPRDLAVLYGILVDKSQLLSGEATSRSEHRDLSAGLDDHEKEALMRVLREAVDA